MPTSPSACSEMHALVTLSRFRNLRRRLISSFSREKEEISRGHGSGTGGGACGRIGRACPCLARIQRMVASGSRATAPDRSRATASCRALSPDEELVRSVRGPFGPLLRRDYEQTLRSSPSSNPYASPINRLPIRLPMPMPTCRLCASRGAYRELSLAAGCLRAAANAAAAGRIDHQRTMRWHHLP